MYSYNTQWAKACRAGFATFVVLGVLGQLAESQVVQKQCAEFNEYCQNHWDCCSNSCMSFLYRCTRGSAAPQPDILTIAARPEHKTDNWQIEQRFGKKPSSTSTQQVGEKKCAQFNEYCQNHWDCCSNSCMSYLYRCTRGSNEPSDAQENIHIIRGTYEDVIAMAFGIQPVLDTRSGVNDEKTTTTTTKTSERLPTATSATATSTHQPATTISQFPSTTIFDELGTTTLQEEETNPNAIDQTPRTDNKTTPAVVSNGATTPCKKVGELCYRHEQCCTRLCHNYLSRCVT